jgi:hypothetical protein
MEVAVGRKRHPVRIQLELAGDLLGALVLHAGASRKVGTGRVYAGVFNGYTVPQQKV